MDMRHLISSVVMPMSPVRLTGGNMWVSGGRSMFVQPNFGLWITPKPVRKIVALYEAVKFDLVNLIQLPLQVSAAFPAYKQMSN